jgi:glycosyltransferase involved in cell wall biosynthesis
MVDLSVAIRTYNGAQHLPGLLEALQAQLSVESLNWEIIIVDNNSTDDTPQVIQSYQQHWTVCPLRYCLESRQGASFARKRAIREANGTLIGFLDDDNIPSLTWVRAAYDFGIAHPNAAAFGSQIHAHYEVAPPQNFDRIAQFIPVIERDESVCFTRGKRALTNVVPPGAGLVIRRSAWLEHVPAELNLKGPVGNSLAYKGEDVEALLHLKKAGWEIWFNADMHISHQISQKRFERDYLMRFFQGVGLSKYTTRMVPYLPWQRPVMTVLYLASDLRKILHHLLKHGYPLHQDLVAACELQMFVSSLVSPFYTGFNQVRKRMIHYHPMSQLANFLAWLS